jgi:DNA-binding PadR family transcriptional regulator
MTVKALPTVTQHQFAFLVVLEGGGCTAEELRKKLRRRGADCSREAFYRVIQRLKTTRFVAATKIPKGSVVHDGARRFYELTEAGRGEVEFTRAFYEDSAELPSEAEYRLQLELGRW